MMRFPLDNEHRKSPGVKTAAIHDRTGRIVLQVQRVNLPRNMGESIGSWRERETRETTARASALVRLLNAAHGMVNAGSLFEQGFLQGMERFADEPDGDVAAYTAASTEVKQA